MKNITIIMLVLLSNISHSQSIQLPREIKSPNASSLGKFGDIPISYYTGRANVSVPIYSIENDGIPLEISLSYDTGGVRVNEAANWIGQNWSLNAGGVICRTVKGGLADEYISDPTMPSSYQIKGYYYSRTALQTSNWSSNSNLTNIASNPIKSDYEPDIFSFNFMGLSGKFFLDQNGKWCVQSNQNLKVEVDFADNLYILNRNIIYFADPGLEQSKWQKCIGKIKITDENGNKYTFGGTQSAIEYSQANFFNFNGEVMANAWYLTKIENRHNDTLYTFTYERGDFQAHFYPYYYSKFRNLSASGGQGCYYSETSPQNIVGGTLTIPSYLKQIVVNNETSNVVITFNRSISNYKTFSNELTDNNLLQHTFDLWKDDHNCESYCALAILNSFYLFYHDQNEQLINTGSTVELGTFLLSKLKNYKLDNIRVTYNNTVQSIITLNRNSSTSERLNLLGVTFSNLNNNKILSYKFQYNNFNLLPSLLSKQTDHWGYYNGTDYNLNTSNIATNFYNLKQPNATLMKYGCLSKIIFPTGGYTEFEYEPHDYSQFVNGDLTLANGYDIAGGLRVKKIKQYNGIQTITKEIKYTNAINSNTSSGILAFKNVYYVPSWSIQATDYNATYTESNFSLNSLIPMSNFLGSHIGYSKVFEIEEGNGYTEYQYTDYVQYPDIPYTSTVSLSHNIFDEHIRNDFKRGLEKNISYYNNSNQKLKEIRSFYTSIGNYSSRGFNYDQFKPCPLGSGVYLGNAYEIEYSDFKLSQKRNIDYVNSTTLETITNFTYMNFPNDSNFFGNSFLKTESINFDGTDSVSILNYPFDSNTSENSSMIMQHFFPIEEKIMTKNSIVISKEKTNYGFISNLGASFAMPVSTEKAKGSNPYQQDIVIDSYNANRKVLEFHKPNGVSTSFLWSGDKILVKIVGAKQSDIDALGITYLNNNTNAQISFYTYNSFDQLTKIIYPNGNLENYIYDINNRLEKITDINNKTIKKYEYNLKNN